MLIKKRRFLFFTYNTSGDYMMSLNPVSKYICSNTSTSINYNSSILQIHIDYLMKLYPFIEVGSIGKSILGRSIPYIRIGRGTKEVFYSSAIHANGCID